MGKYWVKAADLSWGWEKVTLIHRTREDLVSENTPTVVTRDNVIALLVYPGILVDGVVSKEHASYRDL